MITSERKIKFVIVEHTPSQTPEQLSKSSNKVIKLYGRGCLIIRVLLMDMEFEKVVEIMGNVELNIAEERELMGEVYRTSRNVEECGIGIVNTLAYSYLISHIVIHLVHFIVMWLNEIPSGKGISKKKSLNEIVIGRHIDLKYHCRVLFELYVEANDNPNITNNTPPRTHE